MKKKMYNDNVDKKVCVQILRNLADRVEKSRNISCFNLDTDNEYTEFPFIVKECAQLSGWVNVDFKIRFEDTDRI